MDWEDILALWWFLLFDFGLTKQSIVSPKMSSGMFNRKCWKFNRYTVIVNYILYRSYKRRLVHFNRPKILERIERCSRYGIGGGGGCRPVSNPGCLCQSGALATRPPSEGRVALISLQQPDKHWRSRGHSLANRAFMGPGGCGGIF